ncbi:superoxide dismutase, partial [Paraphysoderma sedebokerense]
TAGLDVEIKATALTPNQEFSYHIHVSPVVAGNCTSTGGHYDPLNVTARGVVPVPGDLSTFEKGDLSGKFGKLKSNAEGKLSEGGKDKYSDTTITLADLTGRSIVIHDAAGKRIGCADLK